MYCTTCGTQAAQGSTYCATCGTRLNLPADQEPRIGVGPVGGATGEAPPPPHAYPGMPPLGAYPPGYGPPPGSVGYSSNVGFLDPLLNLPLAPWWKRLVAIIIDGAALGAVYFVLLAIIGIAARNGQDATTTTASTKSGALFVGFIVIIILASIPNSLYFGIMNGSTRGQTLGKMALGIAVRDAGTGQPIGIGRGIARFYMTVLFELVLYVPYVLDCLSPLWDKRRQAWHDKVVSSVVIDLRP